MTNDLISRSELKKAFINQECWNVVIAHIVDNAPTVEPEKAKEGELVKAYTKGFDAGVETVRPQGEWITRHKQNSFGQDVVCFECNKCGEYKLPIIYTMITEPLGVCPNCGAKMGGTT